MFACPLPTVVVPDGDEVGDTIDGLEDAVGVPTLVGTTAGGVSLAAALADGDATAPDEPDEECPPGPIR